jgi:hypothetical protein
VDEKGRVSSVGILIGAQTLASQIVERDRDRFVGRASELSLLERCLDGEQPTNVILIHGPGGIGKSALLRELRRRAEARGRETFFVEGGELPPMPDALEDVLAGARAGDQPVVLIDSYERMAGLDGYLRRGLLPSLPARALVVIAGRAAPAPAWFTGGWERVAKAIELRALSRADAFALLAAHGLTDARAAAVVEWADGSPLALALAAETASADDGWTPARGETTPEIMRSLIHRLVEAEARGLSYSALAVAAIARVTTVELLRDVLPEVDPQTTFERLRSLTFAEPLGDGLALHELARRALYGDLRRHDRERERELRRRIVDHLYERGMRGEPLISIEMAHLIENAGIKWGFGWEGAADYRIDDLRPTDAEEVHTLLAQRGLDAWWPLTRRFFDEAPERVAVARDGDDRMCGYMVSMTPSTAPEFADDDPLIGPWLAHARARGTLGNSVLWHDSVDFTGDPRGRVRAMLGMVGALRAGYANPRFAYLPIDPDLPGALTFARSLGAKHLAELDLERDGRRIQCHRIDFGPGGLIAAQRAVVYAELGLAPPTLAAPARWDLEAVRTALRNFRVPHELARLPAATGANADERAESIRTILRDAAERAFGDNENERLLRRVLIRGYLEPAPSHEQAAIDLSLSRAAYFRRLRTATERVAEYLAERS